MIVTVPVISRSPLSWESSAPTSVNKYIPAGTLTVSGFGLAVHSLHGSAQRAGAIADDRFAEPVADIAIGNV